MSLGGQQPEMLPSTLGFPMPGIFPVVLTGLRKLGETIYLVTHLMCGLEQATQSLSCQSLICKMEKIPLLESCEE